MNACRWSSWLLTIGLFLSVNSYSQGVIATYAGRDRAFPADGQLGVPFDASYAKHAADVAAIYRVGLRAVTGGVPAALRQPAARLRWSIGGGPAPRCGRYQVIRVISSGVTSGNARPAVISEGGRSSAPVAIAVQ